MDEDEQRALNERLDGEHGGRTLAKAAGGKRKQWDAKEVMSADDTEAASGKKKAEFNKVKVNEKEMETDDAPKPLGKKEKDKQIKKIQALKKQLDKDLAPLLGGGDSKVDVTDGPEKEEKR